MGGFENPKTSVQPLTVTSSLRLQSPRPRNGPLAEVSARLQNVLFCVPSDTYVDIRHSSTSGDIKH